MAKKESVKVVFEPFPKQEQLIEAMLDPAINVIYYGGAAGGGKTRGALAGFVMLAKLYPGSVWCVIRKDNPRLKKNTIPSFRKILPAGFQTQFIDNISHFNNGSMIIFANENFIKDNDLTWMDGFEPNGFLLEEGQELQHYTFKKAKLRSGRNKINPMPPPKVVVTGNPTQAWPKEVFYEPFMDGTLPDKTVYIPALMSDNPELPKEYVEALSTLDEITFSRYADGNWDAIEIERPFMYSFNIKKHVELFENKPRKDLELWLLFDFNKDPITCLAMQKDGDDWFRVFHEFRIGNSDIEELCDAIETTYNLDEYFVMVSGDASGMNGTALKKNLNYYTVIKERLGLTNERFRIKKANPGIKNTRVLSNALLQRHPNYKINRTCKFLIEDCMFVQVKEVAEGIEIDKNKNKHRTHLLDCLRYGNDILFPKFVKYKV